MSIDVIVLTLLSTLGTAGLMYFILQKNGARSKPEDKERNFEKEEEEKKNIIESAHKDAKQITLEAQDQAIKIKQSAEAESKSIRDKALELEKKVESRIDEAHAKSKEADESFHKANAIKVQWEEKLRQADKARQEQIEKLTTIASLTKEEAKKLILTNIEKTLQNDIARKIKESEEILHTTVDTKAKELLVEAMQHASTDYVAEYTISTIRLSDEDVKGRIIGKEGRNIRAFEDLTGVNVDFEEGEVRLSSYDSVRREIARISLEKLLKDGRIHPARIEEVVAKTTAEVEKIITTAGEELCQTVGVYNLPKELVMKLGNYKYRTSYGQNMIQHTLEETKIGVKLASEIGADVAITKLACLLHDIGKVVTDKEGSHIELGADYLQRFNLPKAVISAVREHHEDKPSTLEGVIVQIADSISGSRPGARYADFENFVKRMQSLEEAAKSFEGVDKAFAISAGRELRVIVKPEDISDAEATIVSNKIAKKIEAEQTFPGTVRVIVIRETRAVSTAT
ncbi:ribonuclease Y [candidate division WWE3 bacterium CG_4_9_14_0_2_um_filter_35_11]|uniref:Ribonuclease Y n=1 Tax=candidate division WWE3 bacterium CG_4_9_14_0_2_um_filter_35_11 TaxID=1975077 RepID=A0A2M8ELD9_UNCKA|nr:MAG: ribonuclease Y [candidate division WWE3 bacterium CG10_big_fil_rev_8_21_14_0_10_35_32]PJC23530.1 MAG: ribonuclease Y [candidate division WWE3 bacterium CG_4_9_14_0_2_um_filter_35_11]